MRHHVKVTVIDKKCFCDLQESYLADPKSGPCGVFEVGDVYELWRDGGRDDFWHFGAAASPDGRAFPCAEAWDCISRYVYTALQGGSIMHRWTADDRQMVACCNDGTRPVVFLIEREDLPDSPEEEVWLAEAERTGYFKSGTKDAYTGSES